MRVGSDRSSLKGERKRLRRLVESGRAEMVWCVKWFAVGGVGTEQLRQDEERQELNQVIGTKYSGAGQSNSSLLPRYLPFALSLSGAV